MRRSGRALRRALLASALVLGACSERDPLAQLPPSDYARPNVLLIVADDLGWNDVGYHGSDIDTPHIDRLAAEGVRLAQFRTAPSCTATRAGLMTGRSPIHFGLGASFK